MGRLFCLRVLGAEEASQNNLYLPSSQSITHLPSLCYWATGPMWLIYSAVQFISSSILARRMQSGSGFMPNFWSPIHSFSDAGTQTPLVLLVGSVRHISDSSMHAACIQTVASCPISGHLFMRFQVQAEDEEIGDGEGIT